MLLTLAEAAARLGLSERQVRYRIRNGELPGEKRGGRWLVPSDQFPDDGDRQERRERRTEAIRAAVDEVLPATAADGEDQPRRRYSVRSLRAFEVALPLFRRASELFGAEHPAASALRQTLEHLGRGCHRFDRPSKAESYLLARDAASAALIELLLVAEFHADVPRLADDIEQELMPAFAGLLRRVDKRRSWSA